MEKYLTYFKKAKAVEALFRKCTRYVFPTTSQPFDEFIRLDDAVNKLRQVECEDVEPVVRCKDCKMSEVFQNDSSGVMARYCKAFRLVRMVADDDYCSYGERKDDE